MERQLITTGDGSHSFRLKNTDETFHSVYGAINESLHIYITNGLQNSALGKDSLTILEVGFGSGLNTLLTIIATENTTLKVEYTAIEPFPLKPYEYNQLNYCDLLGFKERNIFSDMHLSYNGVNYKLRKNFGFTRLLQKLEDCVLPYDTFHLVYFDAFAPDFQPELWTKEIFERLYHSMKKGGVFITYSSKGIVRRELKKAGFTVSKIPGPQGKREITRAIK